MQEPVVLKHLVKSGQAEVEKSKARPPARRRGFWE